MNFLASQDGDMLLNSPTSTRNYLRPADVDRERSKADKVTWFTHNVRIYNVQLLVLAV